MPGSYQVYIMKGKAVKRVIVFDGENTEKIHIDDTIAQIKNKIIRELEKTDETPYFSNSLYLCAKVNHQINLTNINLLQNTHAFHQLLVNMEIDYDPEDPHKRYSAQDVIKAGIKPGEIRPITVGLGMMLDPIDYVFPADPMYIIPAFNISKYLASISYSNNTILMTAGDIVDGVIFAYFAEDVLEYARGNQISEKDVISVYFPSYSSSQPPPPSVGQDSMIDLLYDIHSTGVSNQKYLERGIHQYDISLFSENRALFSLDAIFKNIHCTREMPFIRYKPGIRRDPIYRLYSTQGTRTGKRIPLLNSKKIVALINAAANYKHISIYNDEYNVNINIENDGTIRIQGKIMKSIDDRRTVPSTASIQEIDEMLSVAVNPLLTYLNQYLSKNGYKVPLYTSIRSPAVKINNLSYSTAFMVRTQFELNNACAYSVFDVGSANILRFKRVDNFKKMDAQSALISEIYKKTTSEVAVIEALMNNYGMSNKDAVLRFVEYRENLNYVRKQNSNRAIERTNLFNSIKNPGFLTTLDERRIGEERREIKITVNNLTNVRYIDTVSMYIDSLLYISQTDDQELKDKCSRMPEEEEELMVAPIEEEEEEEERPVFAQPVDINKLIKQFENKSEESENVDDDSDVDLDEFLESDDDAEFLESDDDDDSIEGGRAQLQAKATLEAKTTFEAKTTLEGGAQLVGGDPGQEEDDDLAGIEDAESEYNTTSKAKKNFIRKLKEHDPKLFSFTKTKNGQFKHYTRVCQSMLQPVVLTQEEKAKIDREYKGSYTEAVEYGTSPENKNWFICPRFWCFKTNTSMTKEDIDAGKCGKTKAEIKQNVFEFKDKKEHMNAAGKYVDHFPGFKKDIHPDGYCLPCCFSEWDTQLHKDRRAQCTGKAPGKAPSVAPVSPRPDQLYIIGADKITVDPGRWGFAQYAVQHFLQIDYRNHVNKTNPSMIRDRTTTLLRFGIRQEHTLSSNGNSIESHNRAFASCFADIYARVHDIHPTPSVSSFLDTIRDSITIDDFVQYGNGSYMSMFADPGELDSVIYDDDQYSDSFVYRFLDIKNPDHYRFFKMLKHAYERFRLFLIDADSIVDHTYLWDIVATPNPRIFPDGVNVVLMEIANNDVTENIDLICPTNAYSAYQFKADRATAFIIKTNDIYLPIYKYTPNGKDEPAVVPLLTAADLPGIYNSMENIIGNYCKPQASIGNKYSYVYGNEIEVKQPMPIQKLMKEVAKLDYTIEKQIWNYQGKIVSLLLRSVASGNTVVVPCQPSAPIPDLEATFMDDIRLLSDYATTKAELMKLSSMNHNILCRPIVKVFESNMIVGIITETNQVVRIRAPESGKNHDDDLVPLGENNYAFYQDMAKTVETAEDGDKDRIEVVRNAELEDDFYALFRTTLKSVLESAPASLAKIIDSTNNASLDQMTEIVRDIMAPAVVFGQNNIPDELLNDIYERGQLCVDNGKQIGMLTADKKCIFPSRNLVNPARDNSREYYVRIADELLRYGHLRNFILKPHAVLNTGSESYKVNPDEYIVVESDLLNRDYFSNIASQSPYNQTKYTSGIPFDMANPDAAIAKRYSNEVSLEEQIAAGDELLRVVNQCKSNIKEVYGHPVTNYWRRWVFPHGKNARKVKEIYFKGTAACSFAPIIYVLQDHFKELYTEEMVRAMIWEGYRDLLDKCGLEKICILFEIQGKRAIADRIRGGESFEMLVRESGDYFATIMDMWVVFHKYNVPVIAFSSAADELSGMGITALDNPLKVAGELPNAWLIMGGTAEHRAFYFVRAPSIVRNYKKDVVPEHQMIFGPVLTTEMERLEPKLQSALLRLEYVQRIQGPEYFVSRVVRLKK